jgi:hypothetical protein
LNLKGPGYETGVLSTRPQGDVFLKCSCRLCFKKKTNLWNIHVVKQKCSEHALSPIAVYEVN